MFHLSVLLSNNIMRLYLFVVGRYTTHQLIKLLFNNLYMILNDLHSGADMLVCVVSI